MSMQGQLALGAGDLIAATHKSGKKDSGDQFDDCLWLAAYGNFKEGFYCSVTDAISTVNELVQQEAEDCYWTPSGFNYPKSGNGSRALQNVSKLECLFVDLDYYSTKYSNLDSLQLVDQIQKDVPWLPSPSVVIDSGRGCWMLWLFQRPLVINKRTKKLDWMSQWYSCQKFLNELLAPYGADANAVDASRYMRLPETINSKSGRLTQSWIYARHKGKRVDYQFTDLKKLFKEHTPQKQKRNRKKPGTKPHGRINGIDTILTGYSLSYWRMQDLETLIRMRGGKLSDMRKRAVHCYLVEAAHFSTDNESLTATVDYFIDEYIEDPETYKTYYRKELNRVIHRAEYVRTQLIRKTRKQAFLKEADGRWNHSENRYTHTNKRVIQLLGITLDEMRKVSRRPYLKTLIGKDEKAIRRREREGSMERHEYEKRASERAQEAQALAKKGMSQRQIAGQIGVKRTQVQRYLS